MGGKKYSVGIDVGTHSIGFAAVETNEAGDPVALLNSMVLMHDSGLDPSQMKTASTRLAESGVARRTRRLVRRRRKRLIALDHLIESLGWPIAEVTEDPRDPWRIRAELAQTKITDPTEQKRKLSIALRHIARHRGWRNPYSRPENLRTASEPTEKFMALREEFEKQLGVVFGLGTTIGEMIAESIAASPTKRLRGEGGLISVQLQQSDHANEILKIAKVQELDNETTTALIDAVFKAESPKGSAAKRVGKDPLPGQRHLPRASKASDAFQRYRIVSILANLRVREPGINTTRRLTVDERAKAFDFLLNFKPTEDPTWIDVADAIGVSREHLVGTATPTADGERASARPPVHKTDRDFRTVKLKALAKWWPSASQDARDAMTEALSNAGSFNEDSAGGVEVQELLSSLSDEETGKLDSLHIAAGRAAYSEDSLRKLIARMLETEDDVHDARKNVFGVDDSWTPPAEPINAPVGNPAVDRVLKGVARWLSAAEATWGAPERIVIEHVREAFVSERMARERDRENNKRYENNILLMQQIKQSTGSQGEIRRSDITRFQAITRQNGKCLYCDNQISFQNAEMDHIVPRAGIGSNNKRSNLVAVCERCNKSKGNKVFSTWAANEGKSFASVEAAVERTKHWLAEPGQSKKEFTKFIKEVQDRLSRKEGDPEFDGRSMESVAWMASELRTRIHQHFKLAGHETKVSVYRGALTSEARNAAGLSGRINFIGGGGKKTRLDRRHHAVDAAVITMIDESVAKTLAERVEMRNSQRIGSSAETWKEHVGSSPAARTNFLDWQKRMHKLSELISLALDNDRIPVTENLRLRLGNGAAHDDTIRPLVKLQVGDELSVEQIDRAASPALWVALTNHPDFDEKAGLPNDPSRRIRLHSQWLDATDQIEFFGSGAAAIKVRGGYAEIGGSIHHARVFKIDDGKKVTYAMLRVFTTDLLRHRHGDLFTAPIPPQSISMRTAESKLRQAIGNGTATELGWLVVGDELVLDVSSFNSGQIGGFLSEFPDQTRWKLDGIMAPDRMRLRPVLIASEGLSEENSDETRKIVDTPGWRPSLNVLFANGKPTIVRRDSLGRPRFESNANLPVTWSIRGAQ